MLCQVKGCFEKATSFISEQGYHMVEGLKIRHKKRLCDFHAQEHMEGFVKIGGFSDSRT